MCVKHLNLAISLNVGYVRLPPTLRLLVAQYTLLYSTYKNEIGNSINVNTNGENKGHKVLYKGLSIGINPNGGGLT